MKGRDLIKRITDEAKRQSVTFEVRREGANHTVYNIGGVMVPVPRHGEIDDRLAETIYKQCEPVLGKRWWK